MAACLDQTRMEDQIGRAGEVSGALASALADLSAATRVQFVFVKSRDDEPHFQRGKSHCVALLDNAS